MHRYLAPKSWKEWTREGVLQAFIIAFYAEMYGLPLTNCLARFVGLDLAWTEGGNFRAQRFGTNRSCRRDGHRLYDCLRWCDPHGRWGGEGFIRPDVRTVL